MADEDIYGSKKRYEQRIRSLNSLCHLPGPSRGDSQRRYHCQNPENLCYFKALDRAFAASDISYIRRLRYISTLLFLTHHTSKDLSECHREDIDAFVAEGHKVFKSTESKRCFIKEVKRIWRILFPERDERGRADERLTPYAVRHLTCQVDKSRQRMRDDRLTLEEYSRIVTFFAGDPKMQAYITLAVESLGRPQETCYTRIRDVELRNGHAIVWVSSHGKEGTKFLQCVDSYPYLVRWLEHHPYQNSPDAFLFMTGDVADRPLTPVNINKKLKHACLRLQIQKPITAYSLKRNGVTFSRLRGDSDLEIQHRAGWNSTRQLKTYDLSTADESFRVRLEKLGLATRKRDSITAAARLCECGNRLGFTDTICSKCRRPADTSRTRTDLKTEDELRKVLIAALEDPNRSFADILASCRAR